MMLDWLENALSKDYEVAAVLRERDGARVALLRHRALGALCIRRDYAAESTPYRKLLGVTHPNLPLVYEAISEGERSVVLEEYIEGDTLSSILTMRTLDEPEARRVAAAVCDGLSALHSLSIVHRDIKPSNVLLSGQGAVKLIDLDAARLYHPGQDADTRILGTAGYAAPEQFGLTQSDGRADIFALGVMLNVMLTGEHPTRKLCPGKLGRVIEKCIQVRPDRRYQAAAQLRAELMK